MKSPDDVPGDSEHWQDTSDWPTILLPCERCGDLVPLIVDDAERGSVLWGEGTLKAWCNACWPHRDDPVD